MLAYPVNVCIINTDFDAANWYGTKMSPHTHHVPRAEPQHHVINPTHPGGAFDDSIEDRLHVRGRSANDTKDLGGRRLMLQRLTQFCISLLNLLEQPHVLDGDDCLVSKNFKKS